MVSGWLGVFNIPQVIGKVIGFITGVLPNRGLPVVFT